eukprot:3117352-Karenia_brevis.AAC.1
MESTVGEVSMDVEKMLRSAETVIWFGTNPHRSGTKIHDLFENIRDANTIGEAKKKGATLWELRDWQKGGWMKLVSGRVDSEAEAVTVSAEADKKGSE